MKSFILVVSLLLIGISVNAANVFKTYRSVERDVNTAKDITTSDGDGNGGVILFFISLFIIWAVVLIIVKAVKNRKKNNS